MIVYLNPQLLQEIDNKARSLQKRWDYDNNQYFQLYTMVAAIELGVAEDRCFYHDGGIVCSGWNGYSNPPRSGNPDPHSAYQGFYRMEQNQYIGWSAYCVFTRDEQKKMGAREETSKEQWERLVNLYGFFGIWEEEPMQDGFKGWKEFWTAEEARDFAESERKYLRSRLRTLETEYNDYLESHIVTIQSVGWKPNTPNVYKCRVPVTAKL